MCRDPIKRGDGGTINQSMIGPRDMHACIHASTPSLLPVPTRGGGDGWTHNTHTPTTEETDLLVGRADGHLLDAQHPKGTFGLRLVPWWG